MIKDKIRLPVGMHKWCQNFQISNEIIHNSFTFPWLCTLSTKSRNIQYKISTFTLPTGEYLWNYKVRDNYYCERCQTDPNILIPERDNILHSLYSCPKLQPFLMALFDFIIQKCKITRSISEIEYLLGFLENEGLNCVLLETKKFIFYNFKHDKNINTQINMLKNRLRRIILLEKRHYYVINKIEHFHEKWKHFEEIYMIYGPDPLM